MQRFFYQTHSSATFKGAPNEEDAGGENFYDIHMVGQRDSKYMKYQWKTAPLWDRSLCEHTRAYHAHDNKKDHEVTGLLAEVIKSKQGVGRTKTQPPFHGVTKYTDDYKGCTREQARNAISATAKPVIQVDEKGRAYHPLIGTGKLEETRSHEHRHFGPHPLDLAKTEKAIPPSGNLGTMGHMVPQTTAYREEFFTENGVPRRPLRKPTRCKSAPALRGPVAALPNWMRPSVGAPNWSASRVVPQPPAASSVGSQPPRPRPASAGAIRSGTAMEGVSVGRVRAPSQAASSAVAHSKRVASAGRLRARDKLQRPQKASTATGARRPASAGALRSRSSCARPSFS